MEKIVGPTPSGGDFLLIHYTDAHGNEVEKGQAKQITIAEYKDDGTLICTTYGEL